MQTTLKSPRFRRRALLSLGGIALGIGALWFAAHIPRTLAVFVIAAFVAFGTAPIVDWLERRVPRQSAIAIVYVGLVLSAVILTVLVVPATIVQLQSIAANAPAYIDVVQSWIDGVQKFMAAHFGKSYLPPGYGDLRGFLAARISESLNATLSSLSEILIGTFTAAFVGVSALVLSAFFLLRGDTVAEPIYALLPEHRRTTARRLGVELAHVFGGYVTGQAALCAITGALVFAFTLATGFKFALLLGIVAGLAYAVPFVGMLVAHAIALVLAAPQGPQTVIWTQVIIFTIARVADNVLVPKVMSESVGVSPIVVMFSVFAGGELFGLPGLLLGIPVAALAKVAWQFFRAKPVASEMPAAPESADVASGPSVVIVEAPPVVTIVR
ncbi:MAG: AI-2E family transporter [Vulcanimicrobiaceae bacterium]